MYIYDALWLDMYKIHALSQHLHTRGYQGQKKNFEENHFKISFSCQKNANDARCDRQKPIFFNTLNILIAHRLST